MKHDFVLGVPQILTRAHFTQQQREKKNLPPKFTQTYMQNDLLRYVNDLRINR